jgi:hypothetical protein
MNPQESDSSPLLATWILKQLHKIFTSISPVSFPDGLLKVKPQTSLESKPIYEPFKIIRKNYASCFSQNKKSFIFLQLFTRQQNVYKAFFFSIRPCYSFNFAFANFGERKA